MQWYCRVDTSLMKLLRSLRFWHMCRNYCCGVSLADVWSSQGFSSQFKILVDHSKIRQVSYRKILGERRGSCSSRSCFHIAVRVGGFPKESVLFCRVAAHVCVGCRVETTAEQLGALIAWNDFNMTDLFIAMFGMLNKTAIMDSIKTIHKTNLKP